MILLADPLSSYKAHQDNIQNLIKDTLVSGEYILGQQVKRFEQSFAKYIGAKSAVGVNSGTDALELALRSLDIGPGDEVITVSHTALATISAIITVGATPVLADICPLTLNVDIGSLTDAISSNTKAIILVHLYGNPGPVREVLNLCKDNGVKFIEDCAQIAGGSYEGQKLGSYGDISAFSFYPTKNLGGFGDGGAVVTSNSNLCEKVRRLRQYGWDSERLSDAVGRNSRLDVIQASILSYRLNQLDRENDRRREIAEIYHKKLSHLKSLLNIPVANGSGHAVYHLYVVVLEKSINRKKLMDYLKSRGIQSGIHYPVAVHQQQGYKEYVQFGLDKLKNTENAAERILSLPMHPWLSNADVHAVSTALQDYLEQ
jgi:dTDP-4-amino-4,6-dideoxygalactose transaminase